MKYAAVPHDPYIDPASGILRNRLGITDAKELERAEADFAALASHELDRDPPPGTFDLSHLQVIHQRLFGKVYAWAGELRQVDIVKGATRLRMRRRLSLPVPNFLNNSLTRNILSALTLRLLATALAFTSAKSTHCIRSVKAMAALSVNLSGSLHMRHGYHIRCSGMSRDAVLRASIFAYHSGHTALATLIRDNLAERTATQSLDVSRCPLETAMHHYGLIIRDAAMLKRDFKGEVVATTSQHALVQVSDVLAVHYEKSKLDRDVYMGEKLAIRYKDQKNLVYEQGKEPTREQERGLERDRGVDVFCQQQYVHAVTMLAHRCFFEDRFLENQISITSCNAAAKQHVRPLAPSAR